VSAAASRWAAPLSYRNVRPGGSSRGASATRRTHPDGSAVTSSTSYGPSTRAPRVIVSSSRQVCPADGVADRSTPQAARTCGSTASSNGGSRPSRAATPATVARTVLVTEKTSATAGPR
jgi:hypothetical protein